MKIQPGDSVIVSESSKEYQCKHIGKTGTVMRTFRTKDKVTLYGVKLNSLYNLSSSSGLFWFRFKSLSINFPENSITESEEPLMYENFKTAWIRFLDKGDSDPNRHTYALFDDGINVGDTVVVHTGHHGFTLAVITSISGDPVDRKSVACGREVVCRADFSNYNHRKETRARVAELQKQMDAKVRDLHKLSIYQMFAEQDPSMKALLDEFNSLTSPTGESTSE